MFELKNGMILELCNGDFGVFYDRNVICQSYGFNIDNVGLNNLFGKSIINKESVQTVYRNKCIFIDGMFDHSRYHESSVLWSRNDCIYEGDAFTCMNTNAVDKNK